MVRSDALQIISGTSDFISLSMIYWRSVGGFVLDIVLPMWKTACARKTARMNLGPHTPLMR